MPDRAQPVWNCRESKQACAHLDALASHDDFDRVWTGVRWLIIRNPMEVGRPVQGKTQTYVLKTADFMAMGIPVTLVTYSIVDMSKRTVEIVSVLSGAAAEKTSSVTSASADSAKPKTALPGA
jgi:hypothetical protein